jgi:hemerythrin superfamily protein
VGRSQPASRNSASVNSHDADAEAPEEESVDYASRVIQMLTADHRHVERLFAAAEQAGDDRDAFVAAADAVCAALTEHAELEEEFFYPALRATDARDLAIEAEVEHDVAKQLILELGRMDAEEERYRPTLNVLREYVRHHVDEEEREIFKRAREVGADFEPLFEVLSARDDATAADIDDEETRAPRRSRGVRTSRSSRSSRSKR